MSIDLTQNYFEVFELECSNKVEIAKLEKKYLIFQKEFHPDKFVNATDHEKRLSLQITSFINDAYKTLKNDYLRSVYLLKIKGYGLNENNTISDPDFLMHQMDLREEAEAVHLKKDYSASEDFLKKINLLKENCLKEFDESYNQSLYEQALVKLNKMKFYISIESDLRRNN